MSGAALLRTFVLGVRSDAGSGAVTPALTGAAGLHVDLRGVRRGRSRRKVLAFVRNVSSGRSATRRRNPPA
jgi:hypothetical protein